MKERYKLVDGRKNKRATGERKRMEERKWLEERKKVDGRELRQKVRAKNL